MKKYYYKILSIHDREKGCIHKSEVIKADTKWEVWNNRNSISEGEKVCFFSKELDYVFETDPITNIIESENEFIIFTKKLIYILEGDTYEKN